MYTVEINNKGIKIDVSVILFKEDDVFHAKVTAKRRVYCLPHLNSHRIGHRHFHVAVVLLLSDGDNL